MMMTHARSMSVILIRAVLTHRETTMEMVFFVRMKRNEKMMMAAFPIQKVVFAVVPEMIQMEMVCVRSDDLVSILKTVMKKKYEFAQQQMTVTEMEYRMTRMIATYSQEQQPIMVAILDESSVL